METEYYWVRVYDFKKDRDTSDKGSLLDETYYKNTEKDVIKKELIEKYTKEIKFAKPRKNDGVYALILDSNRFFYDRFYIEIDSLCCECNKKIHSKLANTIRIRKDKYKDVWNTDSIAQEELNLFFCSYDCKHKYSSRWYKDSDVEFQEREQGTSSHGNKVEGYIYEIYNYKLDEYYIGKSNYLPFFRWQEHIKSGLKGEIEDLTFRVITKVLESKDSDTELHNLEAWWIKKYKLEGKKVMNKVVPRFKKSDWEERYESLVADFKKKGSSQLG